jgi:hypothetical protein
MKGAGTQMKNEKLTTPALRAAALEIAEQSGRPLKRDILRPRKQAYCTSTGERVLLRTSNDRVLTATASSTTPAEATLDFEDSDALLIAMPIERGRLSAVEAYWVPSGDAARDVKAAHQRWLNGSPKTNNNNRTYSVWFDEAISSSELFREKWSLYRLPMTLRLSE